MHVIFSNKSQDKHIVLYTDFDKDKEEEEEEDTITVKKIFKAMSLSPSFPPTDITHHCPRCILL